MIIESLVFLLCNFFKHKRAVQVFRWQRLFFGTITIQLHNLLKISSRQLMKWLAYCGSSDWPGLYNSLEKLMVAENGCGTQLSKKDKQYLWDSISRTRSVTRVWRTQWPIRTGASTGVLVGGIPHAQNINMMQFTEVYHLEESLLFESWGVQDWQKSPLAATQWGSYDLQDGSARSLLPQSKQIIKEPLQSRL